MQKVKVCSYLVESFSPDRQVLLVLCQEYNNNKIPLWARETAWWAKVPTAMPDGLSWPRWDPHGEHENERTNFCKLSSNLYTWHMDEHAHAHIHIHNTHTPVCLKQWSNQKGMSVLEMLDEEQRMVVVPDIGLVVCRSELA